VGAVNRTFIHRKNKAISNTLHRKKLQHRIADANERYQATMQPVSFEERETESILKAEASGKFDGSPIVLNYHLEIVDDLIRSLKITGQVGMANFSHSFFL